MHILKRMIACILMVAFLMTCICAGGGSAFAHDYMLDVEYDSCVANTAGNGIDEMWYALVDPSACTHMSDDVLTIQYYFINNLNSDDAQDIPIDSIKEAYANSMKKWDSIYFYSYDDLGNVVKNKLVNVVEGTSDTHNLPIYLVSDLDYPAVTAHWGGETIETGAITHLHCGNWSMDVRVSDFYVHGDNTSAYVNHARERVGAHELGHVLGLRDIESCCDASAYGYHHSELLMGAALSMQARAKDITYQDIAGVAITRGFHTDNDHKWLYKDMVDGRYKLVCSICNGVKWIDSFDGYTYGEDYYSYGMCLQNHALSSGNMMAVASYENTDYYKCKYCRYVAPFSANVEQDYSVTYNDTYHYYANNVDGLEYTITERHRAQLYRYINSSSHRGICSCGKVLIEAHAILRDEIENGRYATCIGCHMRLDLQNSSAEIVSVGNELWTQNGSYILPNGIVVLVEADVEAYKRGTLEFYSVNTQTSTE